MKLLQGVLLIAAHSASSQAYVQTLAAHGLAPAHALLLGESTTTGDETTLPAQYLHGVRLPDLGLSLSISLNNAGVPITLLETRDINAPGFSSRCVRWHLTW